MTGLIGVAHAPSPYRASNQRSDDGTLKVVQTVDMQMRKQITTVLSFHLVNLPLHSFFYN
jgi:hypothetical protein